MRRLKVVLVEDEEIVLKELVETIDWDGLGLEVAGTAADGIEGENLIKRLSPDIVVTDIKLPGKNGLQMIEDADVTNGIILSGYTDFEYTRRAIQLGVFDYIEKPVDDDVLIASVQKSIERLDEERIKEEQISKIGSYLKVRKESLALDDDSDSAEIARKVSAYLETNYDKRIGLDEIARDCGYSKYHLSRIFKKATGKTVIDSLTQIRISKAKELLAITKESVKNIAFRTGFSDPAYFTWAFRKAEGVTPLQYRASALRK